MAINPFQINDLNQNLFFVGGTVNDYAQFASQQATEHPLVPDNINNQLANMTLPMACWSPFNWGVYQRYNSDGTTYGGTWIIPTASANAYAVRPAGAFFIRNVSYQNELTGYGYVGGIVGGYLNPNYSLDQVNSGAPDYEPAYGHGVATWPMPADQAHQFRDSSSLPADGSSQISYAGPWTRSPYLHATTYLAHIIKGGTLASGISFILEQRPTANMVTGNRGRSPMYSGSYELFTLFPNRTTNSRASQVYLGRLMNCLAGGNGSNLSQPNEDGSAGTNVVEAWDPATAADFPILRPSAIETRTRQAGIFGISEEYLGMVQGSALMIFSNKSSMIPIQFWDLALSWPQAVSQRIAGVAVDPATHNIWIMSESGELRTLHFSVSGGQMLTKPSAPVLTGGECYGACSLIGNTLYTLTGTWTPTFRDTSTAGTVLGVTPFDTVAGTWGVRTNSPLQGRHNTRSLHEMHATREGYLAIVTEVVAVNGANVTNAGGQSQADYQLMMLNPIGNVWNSGALTFGGKFTASWALTNNWCNGTIDFLHDVAPGTLLVKAGFDNSKMFIYNYAGVWDDSKWLDVSCGSITTIMPAVINSVLPINIQKSRTDDSVVFHNANDYQRYSGQLGPQLYRAHVGFQWDGSQQLQQLQVNSWGGGNTNNFSKDCMSTCDSVWSKDGMALGGFSFPAYFADAQVGFFCVGTGYNSGWSLWPASNGFSTSYLPRYWKWSGTAWVEAKNWADAAASPYTVPVTPGQAIPIIHGLTLSFGPLTNTTFQAGEFHTINVAYGNVKYARRARYTFTMFAGRTFQNVETRTMSSFKAIVPQILRIPVVQRPPTFSGPASITPSGAGCSWPVMNGSVTNDTPLVATYDLSLVPPSPSIVPVMTGNVQGPVTINASAGAGWIIFSNLNIGQWSPSAWYAQSVTGWVSVDFGQGATKTVRGYILRLYRSGNYDAPTTTWTLQGSNNNVGWTDLDTPTGVTWSGRPCDGLAVTNAYYGTIATPAPFRYYRIVFAEGRGYYLYVASLEMFDLPWITTGARFTDITMMMALQGPSSGYKFEVNTGSGFTPIAPLWSSHLREIFVFPTQTNVLGLRITSYTGMYNGPANRCVPEPQLWDYGTQAVIDAARLGSASASDATPTRGSFDTQSLGIAADAVGISVDGVSPQQYTPMWSADYWNAFRGWWGNGPWSTQATRTFCVHPYFGFLVTSPDVSGTNVQLTYSWGRRT